MSQADTRARQVGGDHYINLGIQPWDAMRCWMTPEEFQGFLRGNAIKYVARCRSKGGVEDLRKAMHYLETLIGELEPTIPAAPTHHRRNPAMQALQLPPLAEGETYVGAIGDQQGNLHHIILLAADADDAAWDDQMAWAKSLGADLPTRVEQALIWERCRDRLKKDFYWSNETRQGDSSCAWCQYFLNGTQDYGHKSAELRAVAVRRLPI